MFDIALGIFLLISPIVFMPFQIGNMNALVFYSFGVLGNDVSHFQWLYFVVSVIGLFIISLLSKPQRRFDNKWIVILLSLFCINVYLHPIGIRLFSNIFLGFLFYYLVVVYTQNYKSLFKFIFISSLLNTIFAILQFIGIHWIYQHTGRVDGLMCLSTHLGVYQAIVLPICYAINPWLSIIPIIGIILSKSIAAITILFILIFIKLFKPLYLKGKNIHICNMTALLISSIIFVIFNWHVIMNKASIRFMVWLPTLKQIIIHPFSGYGIKPFALQSEMGLFENPCSIYVQLVWTLGILSLIPLYMIIRRISKSSNTTLILCSLAILLSGIEKSVMDYPRLAGTIIILLALTNINKGETNYVN